MKIAALTSALVLIGAMACAQNASWPTSKEVTKIQMKPAFRPARVVTGEIVGTKAVNAVRLTNLSEGGTKVKMTGLPPGAISKGVARMQYRKGNK